MRFVSIYFTKKGMIIGKDIYYKDKVIIRKGIKLKESYINELKKLGFNGIYIEDDLSNDIYMNEIVREEVKNKAVNSVKNFFNKTITNSKNNLEQIFKVVDNLIDDVLNSDETIVNIVNLKNYDEYTFQHSVNVAILSILLGIYIGLNEIELKKLTIGALLHDIGKIFIDKSILNKNGKLNNNEYKIIQTHSELGYKYIKENFGLQLSPTTTAIILQHHEKYDGTGYPLKLKENNISLFSRIVAIADVYDALTSDRPYRKAWFPFKALDYIKTNVYTHFDPKLTKVFLKIITPYPVGTIVQLDNGEICIVVENNINNLTQPIVKLLEKDNEYIDLSKSKFKIINVFEDLKNQSSFYQNTQRVANIS